MMAGGGILLWKGWGEGEGAGKEEVRDHEHGVITIYKKPCTVYVNLEYQTQYYHE